MGARKDDDNDDGNENGNNNGSAGSAGNAGDGKCSREEGEIKIPTGQTKPTITTRKEKINEIII